MANITISNLHSTELEYQELSGLKKGTVVGGASPSPTPLPVPYPPPAPRNPKPLPPPPPRFFF